MGGGEACAMAPPDPGTPPDPAHLLQVGPTPGHGEQAEVHFLQTQTSKQRLSQAWGEVKGQG